jgi:hypothetical protein
MSHHSHRSFREPIMRSHRLSLTTALGLRLAALCASPLAATAQTPKNPDMSWMTSIPAPSPDPRVGLHAGQWDAAEAAWNMRVVSRTRPSEKFAGSINSDMAFKGNYVIQGSFNGYQIWDVSNPAAPSLKIGNYCPASQSDVSVYKNLLFVSSEGSTGRIDCGAQGVKEAVSAERIRGVRIFDITDITHPRNVANVQSCRGSHTHTVLVDPKDKDNVYVYISGSADVRPAAEMAGCVANPDDPNTTQFHIEVVRVPLAHPENAAIVSSPRIFNDLRSVKGHGPTLQDTLGVGARMAAAEARGAFVGSIEGDRVVLSNNFVNPMLDSVVAARGGSGAPTARDSAALRTALPGLLAKMFGADDSGSNANRPGVTQCHDITVYPAVGLAGGACEGYGLLIDIKDPTHPVRLDAASDTNFSYWHSATFNNDGTKLLFSDEWGGGGAPKCRASDPKEWGADAIFAIENGKLKFQSYYKMPAAQTPEENCVAHNGSLIPIPGRDVMVQAWYQGGLSVFDWTDARHPREIAFFDRGPVDSTRMAMGGSWSVYWYNGEIVSSEIARGLDIVELTPSAFLTQNEIDAARSVKLDFLNAQGQPKFVWPATFALSRAYTDQLERTKGLSAARIADVRKALNAAESATGAARRKALTSLASGMDREAAASNDAGKVRMLGKSVRELAGGGR